MMMHRIKNNFELKRSVDELIDTASVVAGAEDTYKEGLISAAEFAELIVMEMVHVESIRFYIEMTYGQLKDELQKCLDERL